MKLETGIHPGRWHLGAWILLALLLAVALLFSHRATGVGAAWAGEGRVAQGGGSGNAQRSGQAPSGDRASGLPVPRVLPGATRDGYVAEVVDSLFFVSPAGFLALDLPRDPAGSRSVHLSGNVSVRGRNRDIMLRLFRSKDYDAWLHPRGGSKGEPFWVSKRGRSHQLDLALPEQGPFVLLLDNGYSIRTPKHVSCQLQIEYRRAGGVEAQAVREPGATGTTDTTSGVYDEANPVTPRGNADNETPPPPPPPPAGY